VTVVTGLKGADGVVLASDSQATYGELKQSQTKLFKMPYGVIWGLAGPFSATQDLYTALEAADLSSNPGREEAKATIQETMRATIARLPEEDGIKPSFEALFAWYDASEKRHYLLRGLRNAHVEFDRTYGAIGSAETLGRFGFTRTEFFQFQNLPLETTRLITYMVTEEAVKASSKAVDLPIQLALVSGGEARVLRADEVEGTSNAVGFYRERQRELLTGNIPSPRDGQRGIRPRPA
jgi:ATP-dependent protease HslVU (ClpYQ) peptidase subunit